MSLCQRVCHMIFFILSLYCHCRSLSRLSFFVVQGWGLLSQFSSFRYFPFFPNDQNSGYLYDIKFIFGRCHRSWAAETPGKYEHDWNYMTYTFAKSKIPVTEKLANGALVTPIPGFNIYPRPVINCALQQPHMGKFNIDIHSDCFIMIHL